jgi:PAS domain S-box-containing protein
MRLRKLFHLDIHPSVRSSWQRYGMAAGSILVGWMAREALTTAVGPTALPFIFFFPAVALSAWYGGLGPGLFTAAGSAVAAHWFFFGPVQGISSVFAETAAVAAFLIGCLFIIGAAEAMHRARIRLARETAERERTVLESARVQNLLAATLASIGDGVIVTDARGNVTFLNATAERTTRWRNKDAVGRSLKEVFPIVNEASRESCADPVERVLSSGAVVGLGNHTILVAKDGTEVPIDDSAAPIRAGDGPIAGVVLVFRDVTEQRQADFARARLAAIVEFSGDAIATKDLNGIVQTWNKAAQRMFGYRPEEIVGKSITMIIPPERLHEEVEILADLRAGRPHQRIETVRVTKDGRRIHVSVSVSPLKDKEGRVIGASKILHDVTDIVLSRKAIHEESRRKDEFLAILSHELRNPLAPIRMAVAILNKIGPRDSELQKFRDVIDRQTMQMTRLLDDLLDISRISSGKISLRKDRINIGNAISSAVESIRPLMDARGHELIIDVPDAPIYVDGDSARLSQVFTNLLNNAAKYSNRGDRITLSLQLVNGDAVIRVLDHGIGLTSEQMSRIFEMFAQVGDSLERREGGLGVGLALARTLVELHGGQIEVRSPGLGQGSEFTVRLPAVSQQPATTTTVDTSTTPPQPLRRILVADDNIDSAETLASLLRSAGHEVRTAHEGASAVDTWNTFRPDLAILDIGMPNLNGYEVARQIRSREDGVHTVLIAITGWGQEKDKRRARDAGFDHHLTKPVDPPAITKILAQLR